MPPTRPTDRHARRRARRPARRPVSRRGIALAEVVVALGMLAVGLLALAGASVALLRADSEARTAAAAAMLVGDRIERVVASPCVDSSGVRVARAVDERWRTFVADDTRTIADTARYALPGRGTVALGVEVPVRCAP